MNEHQHVPAPEGNQEKISGDSSYSAFLKASPPFAKICNFPVNQCMTESYQLSQHAGVPLLTI